MGGMEKETQYLKFARERTWQMEYDEVELEWDEEQQRYFEVDEEYLVE